MLYIFIFIFFGYRCVFINDLNDGTINSYFRTSKGFQKIREKHTLVVLYIIRVCTNSNHRRHNTSSFRDQVNQKMTP